MTDSGVRRLGSANPLAGALPAPAPDDDDAGFSVVGVGGTDAVLILHLDASATAVRSWSRIGRERLANPDVEPGSDFGASLAALGDVHRPRRILICGCSDHGCPFGA